MWILARKQDETKEVPLFDEVNYFKLSNEKRIEILLSTLSDSFEIYFRKYEDIIDKIMIFDKEYEEFIHEGEVGINNLIVF